MNFPKNVFVTAIGTDSGKTLISALLVEALQADYWKPIQSGFPRDTETVRSLVSNTESRFYTEAYLLGNPMSPHAAAALDQVRIDLGTLQLPETSRTLIVEGAGGMMVPVNDQAFVIDLALQWQLPIVLVSNLYLGSINHTLLSIRYLKSRKANCLGIIFNGEPNPSSEEIIAHHSPYPVLHHVLPMKEVNQQSVKEEAEKLRKMIGRFNNG